MFRIAAAFLAILLLTLFVGVYVEAPVSAQSRRALPGSISEKRPDLLAESIKAERPEILQA